MIINVMFSYPIVKRQLFAVGKTCFLAETLRGSVNPVVYKIDRKQERSYGYESPSRNSETVG